MKRTLYKVTGRESDFYPVMGANYQTLSAHEAALAYIREHPNVKRVWVWEKTVTYEVEASLREVG